MPHKRAKFSERVADKERRGKDLPPANDMHFQSLPKGAMRILNAAKVQADFREKKRQQELLLAAKGKGKAEEKPLQIKGGEKMSDFNRRVESAMAKEVRSSIRATQNSTKKRRKKDRQSAEDMSDAQGESFSNKPASSSTKKPRMDEKVDSKTLKRQREAMEGKPERQQEWEKAASRKRVNDVVKAPPTLTKAPRGESAAAKQRKSELKALLSGQEGGDAAETGGKARLPDPVIKKGGLRREAMLREERERVVNEYRQNKKRMLER